MYSSPVYVNETLVNAYQTAGNADRTRVDTDMAVVKVNLAAKDCSIRVDDDLFSKAVSLCCDLSEAVIVFIIFELLEN